MKRFTLICCWWRGYNLPVQVTWLIHHSSVITRGNRTVSMRDRQPAIGTFMGILAVRGLY